MVFTKKEWQIKNRDKEAKLGERNKHIHINSLQLYLYLQVRVSTINILENLNGGSWVIDKHPAAHNNIDKVYIMSLITEPISCLKT